MNKPKVGKPKGAPTDSGMKHETAAEPTAPRLGVMTQYIRDLSFENPAAPNFATGNPEINVNANVGARKLSDTDYEVSLKFRLEAKQNDTMQFLVELDYCGVFRLENIAEKDLRPILLIEAPRQIFPFARRVLADATRDGGYPPVLLDPIDFAGLYQQGTQNGTTGEGDKNIQIQ